MDTLLNEMHLFSEMSAKKQRKTIKMFCKRNTIKCWWHKWNPTTIIDKKSKKTKCRSKGTRLLTTFFTRYVGRRSIKQILVFKYSQKSKKCLERMIWTNSMIEEKRQNNLLQIHRIIKNQLSKTILEIKVLWARLKNSSIQTPNLNLQMRINLRRSLK